MGQAEELRSLFTETWAREANSTGEPSVRHSVVDALRTSQDVLAFMSHETHLPSNRRKDIPSMQMMDGKPFDSSLVVGVALSELSYIPSDTSYTEATKSCHLGQ